MDKGLDVEDVVCDSYYDTGLIEVSKKRYSNLYRDREKYRRYSKIVGVVCVLIIGFFTSFILAGYGFITEWIKQTENTIALYSEGNKNLVDERAFQDNKISELNNEIAQLRDRIAFLSLSAAMYETPAPVIDTNIGAGAETETIITPIPSTLILTDWRTYINLFTIGQKVPLPVGIDTNTFRCMDYRTITDKTSYQYSIQLLSQTEYSSGLRYYDYNGTRYYTVALATAYGIDLGNAYRVTLENGTVFNIIHAEYKHDIRYPRLDDYGDADKNYDDEDTISVIEFVYDEVVAPAQLISDGEANRWLGEGCDIYGDGCNIKEMVYLGKIWVAN